ncbi:MAG: hypothetical protein LC096_09030 [Bacteroidia bacterium]|nr:hypothetical protein [Bacteroidia bacterium]
MKPEDLKKLAEDVLKNHPSEKEVIAFADGNCFLGSKKNHAENHERTSKLKGQVFSREEKASKKEATTPDALDTEEAGAGKADEGTKTSKKTSKK